MRLRRWDFQDTSNFSFSILYFKMMIDRSGLFDLRSLHRSVQHVEIEFSIPNGHVSIEGESRYLRTVAADRHYPDYLSLVKGRLHLTHTEDLTLRYLVAIPTAMYSLAQRTKLISTTFLFRSCTILRAHSRVYNHFREGLHCALRLWGWYDWRAYCILTGPHDRNFLVNEALCHNIPSVCLFLMQILKSFNFFHFNFEVANRLLCQKQAKPIRLITYWA